MNIDFSKTQCQDMTTAKLFGICDDSHQPQDRAYLNELDGGSWIAVVHNDERYNVTFTAIDNCIEMVREDGRMDSRCDGMLTYNSSIVFIELKQTTGSSYWVNDGEQQLRNTISRFETNSETEDLTRKLALLANSGRPKFRVGQTQRMERFLKETGYILRIENRIHLT